MTADEVTQELLAATASGRPPMPAEPARRFGRLRAALTAGVAAGALILAAPAASAVQASAVASHSALAESAATTPESTLPSTITLTTRRTGSVIG